MSVLPAAAAAGLGSGQFTPLTICAAGGSSGIGKAMAVMLADQGINVVIVAVPDATLDATSKPLSQSAVGIVALISDRLGRVCSARAPGPLLDRGRQVRALRPSQFPEIFLTDCGR